MTRASRQIFTTLFRVRSSLVPPLAWRSACQPTTRTHVTKSNATPRYNKTTATATGTLLALSATTLFYLLGISKEINVHAEAPVEEKRRYIRIAEVRQHGRGSETRWIIRGGKVYDITDWIPNHPGGEVILRAVGGVIDKYWDIFSIHKKQDVYDILEQYYIGDVDPRDLIDGRVPQDNVEDPFVDDPKRDETLKVHSAKPCNAETPVDVLDKFITPDDQFYVRNHLWAPKISKESHRLTIELPDGEEKEYSLEDLAKFKQFEVTTTLQCSGNRRKHMSEGARYTNGLQWGIGALSTATFRGVRLRDVLADAGFGVTEAENDTDIKHVQFQGAEAYGSSIPIDKAMSSHGDVLLVHEMNGKPLSQDHGYPLRVLVPGHVAARSVKWVKRITLAEDESQSQWQQRDYKCFGPNQSGSDVDWSTAPAIQETPVQSAIVSLKDLPKGDSLLQVYGLEEDAVEVKGYAFAGGGRAIVRVDVSPDDGRSWVQAELLEDDAKGAKRWAWKQWKLILPRRLAGRTFVVKAVDEGYNTQPEAFEPHYNFRGNLTSGWHRVPYTNRDYF